MKNSEPPKTTRVFIKNQKKHCRQKKIVEYFITVLNQDRIFLGKEELPKLLTALHEAYGGELKTDEKNIPRFVGANPIKALEHCGNEGLKKLTYVLETPLHYALGKLPADTHKKAVAEAEKLLANCTDDIRE